MGGFNMGEVVELNSETITRLREAKLLREHEGAVDLAPVGPGELQIGLLTEHERTLFIELAHLQDEMSTWGQELTARSAETIARAVRKSKTVNDFGDQYEQEQDKMFYSDAEADEFFKLDERFQYLRGIYNWSIKSRYGFAAVYGVRTGFVVVRVRFKYHLIEPVEPVKKDAAAPVEPLADEPVAD